MATMAAEPPRITVSQGIIATSDREIAVLRLLGRLGIVHAPVLHALIFTDVARRTVQWYTQRLSQRGLIWRRASPTAHVYLADGRRQPKRVPDAFGLTSDGKLELERLQAEPPGISYERLIARDRRAPLPTDAAMVADMLISSWCASVIDEVRRTTMLVGVTCQAHATIIAGELRQTIGALLTLTFDPQQRAYTRPGWQIPWFDGEVAQERYRVLRFALEVDNGRAAAATHFEQAQLYAKFTQAGVYTQLFGGPLRPIILVPPGERGTTVAGAWRNGWPQTTAIISSTARVQHPTHGALWGTYLTVKDAPPQRTTLLGGLIPSLDQWAQLTAAWTPRDHA